VANIAEQESRSLHSRIISGSVVLLSGSGFATAINFAYNIAVARFLGPAGFGHATVVYTLLTIISAVTLSFQIVSAKLVAQQPNTATKAAVYRELHIGSWVCGLLVGATLLFLQAPIAGYLKLPSSSLVALLAVGAAFYVPLGTRRGYIQGAYGFKKLAVNLVIEGLVRLVGSLLLVYLGLGVEGVIAANSAAMAVAYFAAVPSLPEVSPNLVHWSHTLREGLQAMVFFAGQVLINNCDIVLVKHYFLPREAGLYAAAAMVGRVVFALSQSVVNSMFPLVAGTREEDRRDLRVIATSLLMVLGIGSSIALVLRFLPNGIWGHFLGASFDISGRHGLSYLLSVYAATTVIYCLSVVIITHEMSYKIANTSWVQLAFSGVMIAAICRFHSSLLEVIVVQLILLTVLLVLVAIPFLFNSMTRPRQLQADRLYPPMRIRRRVTEDEVIAEFLKSDFGNPAFLDYQEVFASIVAAPNLDDENENVRRRALLFLRHLSLWRELPGNTVWYELEFDQQDLERIRVFPRAQWRSLAKGDFSILAVADRLRRRLASGQQDPFLAKVESLRDRLEQENPSLAAVILIGSSERSHLTILDGNHRLVSSLVGSPHSLRKLRYLCGVSPQMGECCWYNTTPITLLRYGKNVLASAVRDKESELARLLEMPG
jgi:O-antigen/teichoic acid export membrane protein